MTTQEAIQFLMEIRTRKTTIAERRKARELIRMLATQNLKVPE